MELIFETLFLSWRNVCSTGVQHAVHYRRVQSTSTYKAGNNVDFWSISLTSRGQGSIPGIGMRVRSNTIIGSWVERLVNSLVRDMKEVRVKTEKTKRGTLSPTSSICT